MSCSLCDGKCCRELLITATVFDVIRISEKIGKKVEEFAELVEPRVLRVDWKNVVECKEGLYVLALKSRPCIFLDGNRCSIYDVAPLSCKAYPSSLGSLSIEQCPTASRVIFKIHNPGKKNLEKLEREVREHKKIVAKVSSKERVKKEVLEKMIEEGRKSLKSSRASAHFSGGSS
ncbi:MAG: YkgJ family cysteine cluster protein [Bdellovibrio sp.]|nr:MAG: YkgJ family cysteine cluster protein [Bdellovibrio sp.]